MLFVLIAGDAWLVHLSKLWLLAYIPLLLVSLLWVVAYLSSRFVLRALRPHQTRAQTTAVRDFVDKMSNVTDQVHTPVPMIALRVFWDVFVSKKRAYIETVISDSASLRTDYVALRKYYQAEG